MTGAVRRVYITLPLVLAVSRPCLVPTAQSLHVTLVEATGVGSCSSCSSIHPHILETNLVHCKSWKITEGRQVNSQRPVRTAQKSNSQSRDMNKDTCMKRYKHSPFCFLKTEQQVVYLLGLSLDLSRASPQQAITHSPDQ
jgi:hypothetical protein